MGLTPLDWRDKVNDRNLKLNNGVATEHKKVTQAEKHIIAKNENKEGIFTWKEALRQAIDEAKSVCENREQFQEYLKQNFEIEMPRNTKKTVSFIHPAVSKSSVRGATLGEDYTAENIDKQLNNNYQERIRNHQEYNK